MNESNFMVSMASNISFIKNQTATDIINYLVNNNEIKLEKAQIEIISRVIKQSIDASFSKSSNNLLSIYKEMKK